MAFLLKQDLINLAILAEELAEITRRDDTIITAACSSAISEMTIHLHDSYDTDTIFTRTGTGRHQLLLQLGADIAVWTIAARCQAGINLDDREARYKRAVATLKAFEKSETYADLPRRVKPIQEHVTFRSNPKRTNYY